MFRVSPQLLFEARLIWLVPLEMRPDTCSSLRTINLELNKIKYIITQNIVFKVPRSRGFAVDTVSLNELGLPLLLLRIQQPRTPPPLPTM